MSRRKITRRKFLGAGAAATAGVASFTIVPSYVLGAKTKGGKKPAEPPPSEKINFAGIGVGGKGGSDVRGVSKGNNIVALCDVDQGRGAGSFKAFPKAKQYKDFRVMLEKEDKHIDAVTVSTPDHVHAVAALAAMQLGKHVYVQKPMCRTVYECRMLTEAAKYHKVCTQMGNQGHAGEAIRACAEWIWDGAIGDVTEVHSWSDRPIWPQNVHRPKGSDPVPESLDWDLWLGPAPHRPFKKDVYVPFKWRGWWDFGTGAIGDMAVHNSDPAFLAMKLDYPIAAEAVSGPFTDDSPPMWQTITLHFAARGKMPPCKVVWWDGTKGHKEVEEADKKGKKKKKRNKIMNVPPRPEELEEKRNMGGNGILFVGTKGKILGGGWAGGMRIIPETKMKEYLADRKKRGVKEIIPRAKGGHYGEFINAIKEGKPLGASGNFSYSGPFVESLLVGNLAVRAGEKIEWDSKNLKVTNCDKANQWVRPHFRKGWDKGWDKIKI